ncbi:endolytic transglycosylase MltG [Candidatus Endowatersipora endosymbiont of Watersipora subatra]|uniref:endolytic transglycosylase MltG n=1 Tax=Candidatus Endowatersipora endosymbiont of Watersipora subatra TaxID=3077946 RepID=UPI00312C8689
MLLFLSAWYGNKKFKDEGPLRKETTYVVQRGSTFHSIEPDLIARDIIPRQGGLDMFLCAVWMLGKSSQLKAGEFLFLPGMSMYDIVKTLTEGPVIEYSITFPEGWTSYQIMKKIQVDTRLVGGLPSMPLEGTLLPNTYFFPRGTSRIELINRIKQAQKKELARIWATRSEGLPVKTESELVILASIVEKETSIHNERSHIASVFMNRLNKGMRLESDPTIIYGIFGGKRKPKGRPIYRSDIRHATPYNTYRINGLPPTPITNPGLASMKAVAQPLKTSDLFFVADGRGGHFFSETLQQHNDNVLKWRNLKKKKESIKVHYHQYQ